MKVDSSILFNGIFFSVDIFKYEKSYFRVEFYSNQDPENAIQIDLECRPCSIYGNKPCQRGDYACLQNIPPERIVDRIVTLINN